MRMHGLEMFLKALKFEAVALGIFQIFLRHICLDYIIKCSHKAL